MAKRAKLMHKGLKLQCPACGAKELAINLALDDMICTCPECEDSFSPEAARKMIGEELAKWEAMCEWIEMAGEILTPVQSDCDALPLPRVEVEDEPKPGAAWRAPLEPEPKLSVAL